MQTSEIKSISAGITQSGLRAYNERLLLTLLQRGQGLSGRDLAQMSGLSPQTVSVILRGLESDGLIRRGDPVRGKVGKPSVPMQLDSDGILSFGLKIGRRSTELVLMDVSGGLRASRKLRYDYPMPDAVFGFLADGLAEMEKAVPPAQRARICGLGIAAPAELWNWRELVGAPVEYHDAWRAVDICARAQAISCWPVQVVNDATAACRAEHVFGGGRVFQDYAYMFLGAFIGGGVVLNHTVFEGRQGNAGALGPLPIYTLAGERRQLMDLASLFGLEARIQAAGEVTDALWEHPQDWSAFEHVLEPWLDEVAHHLAEAALAACAVIDFEAVILDGAIPDTVRAQLADRVTAAMVHQDKRGLIPPQIVEGQVGWTARAIGAAVSPIISQYLMDGRVGLAQPA